MASMSEHDEAIAPATVPYAAPPPAPRRRWAGWLIALLLTFVAGIVAAGWAARESTVVADYLLPRPAAAPVRVVRTPVPVPVAVAAPADPALADQVDAIDDRLEAIDRRSRTAVGNADRAEGLLVAFAARRAVERGAALGYIEGLIREHFGHSRPQAVAAVIAAARQPVTLAQLRTGLDEAEPALVRGATPVSTWGSLKRELSSLIVLHRSGTDSTAPIDRFARARTALETGQVDAALAEVSRMPGRQGAAAWIAAARRYLAARTALDQLETAALVEPGRVPVADDVPPVPAAQPVE